MAQKDFDLARATPLVDNVYITSRVRFDAAKRLRMLSLYSTTSITLLSCYLVVLNIFQIVFREYITRIGGDILNMCGVAISIVMIVVGLVEYSTSKDSRSKDLELNARQLDALYVKIKAQAGSGKVDADRYEALSVEYNEILASCPVNHSEADFQLFKARSPNVFSIKQSWLSRFLDVWINRTSVFGFYYFVGLILPVGAVWLMYAFRQYLFVGTLPT